MVPETGDGFGIGLTSAYPASRKISPRRCESLYPVVSFNESRSSCNILWLAAVLTLGTLCTTFAPLTRGVSLPIIVRLLAIRACLPGTKFTYQKSASSHCSQPPGFSICCKFLAAWVQVSFGRPSTRRRRCKTSNLLCRDSGTGSRMFIVENDTLARFSAGNCSVLISRP
jgi:hypothetical protein